MNTSNNNNKSNSNILRRRTTGNSQVMPLLLPLRSFPPLYLDTSQGKPTSTKNKKKDLVEVIDQVLDLLLDAKKFEDGEDHTTVCDWTATSNPTPWWNQQRLHIPSQHWCFNDKFDRRYETTFYIILSILEIFVATSSILMVDAVQTRPLCAGYSATSSGQQPSPYKRLCFTQSSAHVSFSLHQFSWI